MNRTPLALGLLALAALSGGCGTVANFWSGQPTPYGGLEKEAEIWPRLMGGAGGPPRLRPPRNVKCSLSAWL
jgi:hypothetical protein